MGISLEPSLRNLGINVLTSLPTHPAMPGDTASADPARLERGSGPLQSRTCGSTNSTTTSEAQ